MPLFFFSYPNKEELFQVTKLVQDPTCSFDETSVKWQRVFFFFFIYFFWKDGFSKKKKKVLGLDGRREKHQRRRIAVKVLFEKS